MSLTFSSPTHMHEGMARRAAAIPQRAHLVGIAGAGMRGIAMALLARGCSVSGSDLAGPEGCSELVSAGAKVYKGHQATNLDGAECVIFSTAISHSNPELEAARSRRIPLVHRAELLAALLAEHETILVSGTHGKTTTTALASLLLEAVGEDPWAFVGGEVAEFGGNVRCGSGRFCVAETDESDGSFLGLPGRHGIITNIEAEHMNHWGTLELLHRGFIDFAKRFASGSLVVCADDLGVRTVTRELPFRASTWSLESDTEDYRAYDIDLRGRESHFSLRSRKAELGRFVIGIPGRHNVSNATGALAMMHLRGIDISKLGHTLAEFRGVGRRFSTRETADGVLIVDDYAHHVSEIRATIAAARPLQHERGGRMFVVFQPHRYTRTEYFRNQFASCFLGLDGLVLTEIYAASEQPMPGLTGEILAKEIAHAVTSPVVFEPIPTRAAQAAYTLATRGDIILFLGAGDITHAARNIGFPH